MLLAHLGRNRTAIASVAVLFGLTIGLTSSQGGYFPTTWGWASTASVVVLAVWLLLSGRTEAGMLDGGYVAALAALTVWIGASIVWSEVPWSSVLELERALVPVTGVAAFLVLVRRRDLALAVGGLLAAITLVAAYGLATRLFPESLGAYDPIATYRLADPIGYWNGLGILCAMGILVAVGIVADETRDWARAASSSAIVVLATTLYFTYSRASWAALALGFGAAIALSPRRLRLVAAVLIVSLPAAIAVLSASTSYALTHRGINLAAAASDGRRLAILIAALAMLAAGITLVVASVERRVVIQRPIRRAMGAGLLLGASGVAVVLLVQLGGPTGAVKRGWHSFGNPPTESRVDLNNRLFSLSGNGRVEMWTVAWDIHRAHRLIGNGAGTFERRWQSRPDAQTKVRDAHSVYAESLAELGLVGFALLVFAFVVPVLGAMRARSVSLIPGLLGAFAAYVVHTGADWDWELTGVTLTGLFVGSLLVVGARRADRTIAVPRRARGVGLLLLLMVAIASLVGLLGNRALRDAQLALERGDSTEAIERSDAARKWMPWSPMTWNARGKAELLAGDLPEAARNFRYAIDLDQGEWQSWLNLAIATDGRERERALTRARSLYPRSSEIARVSAELEMPSTP